MKKYLLFLIFAFSISTLANATHNRAGEITYIHLGGTTYKFKLVTYTDTQSAADRPSLDINWGDGDTSNVHRIAKIQYPYDVAMNIYEGTHTYTGTGIYTIWMVDPNRNSGVVNMINSVNVPFYIETQIVIHPFLGANSSPQLLNPPIDVGCAYFPYLHNPGANDPDGDSLFYELIPCMAAQNTNCPGYTLPTATSSFSIDPNTGTVSWLNPSMLGEYNIAIKITEYRNGVYLGYVIRDMQIIIVACNNNPPEISLNTPVCVIPGDTINDTIVAIDVDFDNITLTATGGAIDVINNPAVFNQPVYGQSSISAAFMWAPLCDHIRKNPYQTLFKATDDAYPVFLSDMKTLLIEVIGPAPKNLTANNMGNSILLEWEKPHCTNAISYDIYRKIGATSYVPATCETGVPSYLGYQKIATTVSYYDTVLVDNNNGNGMIQGVEYCYLVVARYPGNCESPASNEACAHVDKDVPLITNVSIEETDETNGRIYIAWSPANELDTSIVQGPFKYLIYRAEAFGNPQFSLIDSTSSWNDTVYIDDLIDTKNTPYYYRIDLYNDAIGLRYIVGKSTVASSPFLEIIPKDQRLILSWKDSTPWEIDTTVIYRENIHTFMYDSIGYSLTNTYVDSNLVNGKEYCYYVKEFGSYSIPLVINPLINNSQKLCSVPIDLESPCSPEISVRTYCELAENHLIWNNPNNSCANDVVKYDIYYQENTGLGFELIQTNMDPTDTTFIHYNMYSVAGCYKVIAIDSFDNESQFSNVVCVDIDSCNPYRLPNVFTPNGDGINDYFIPFPYDFVEKVDMTIFNRWGAVVYRTEDPNIIWNGKELRTDMDLPETAYFFVCIVYEIRLEGIVAREITGTVTIMR